MLDDKERINELIELYYEDIYRFALSVDSKCDADDIAQKVFAILIAKEHELVDANIKSWLYKTTSRVICKDNRDIARERKNTVHISSEDAENMFVSYDFYNSEAEQDELEYPDELLEQYKERIIGMLSEKEQRLYRKVYEERKRYKVVAEEMGISEKAVSVRVFRTKKKIFKILKELSSELWNK